MKTPDYNTAFSCIYRVKYSFFVIGLPSVKHDSIKQQASYDQGFYYR
jgi:hypothetical protein